ncbi:tetratricopeptide repeat protein [Kitasatospora indigofera]|uniref:tetratricopeptide repeat protein n=1 Tax=Kitasatospora indigofera TaxID=67307 RepID=UPI003631F0C5
MSLNNLSIRLTDVGQQLAGLAAGEEALGLYRALTEANPDAHQPDLARTLNNLSVYLGEVGRRAEGLAAVQEAVAIRRALARANPDLFGPDLQQSLEVAGWLEGLEP